MSQEMWNMQSPERLDLLTALKNALQQRLVPAPFWACLQVCDLEKLAELVDMAKVTPEPLFKLLERSCLSIALHWMGLLPYGDYPAQHLPDDQIDTLATRLTRQRDLSRCRVTNDYSLNVVDIVPVSLIRRDSKNPADEATPDFWQMLGFFFTENRIQRWKQAISIITETEGCRNQICVTSRVKWRWRSGAIAVLPVEASNDHTMTLRFFWQPRAEHSRFELVDILQAPSASINLIGIEGCRGLWGFVPDHRPVPIMSGDTFYLKTHNPATHPLPSLELLKMHWRLNRIMAMSGAAMIFDVGSPIRRETEGGTVDSQPSDDDIQEEDIPGHMTH